MKKILALMLVALLFAVPVASADVTDGATTVVDGVVEAVSSVVETTGDVLKVGIIKPVGEVVKLAKSAVTEDE